MKESYYLLAILFTNTSSKGYQNVYASVKGEFILSEVVAHICQEYGYQKVTVMSRIEITEQEFAMNKQHNPEVCC